MVNAAPGLIDQAKQLQTQAQQMVAAQQAAAQANQSPTATPQSGTQAGPDFEPVAGVSLEQYAQLSKQLAPYGADQSAGLQVLAGHGISPDSWEAALAGWSARMKANPAVAAQFNAYYLGA
jgi:hypothetical protein